MTAALGIFSIAKKNIRRRPWRSFCLTVTVLLLSCFLFAGTALTVSLARGAQSMGDRLGADIMVVPAGFDPHIDDIILSGRPSSFYLPHDVMERLSAIEGIDRMTPQTFLATLRASCCSYPLQLVGIDYQTDFLIKPWLNETLRRDLKKGEAILGHRVSGEPGDTLHFFGVDLKIAGRLEQTGMGFDATVFMTRETIADLAKAAEKIFQHPLSKDGSLISTVMLKLRPGYDSVAVAQKINAQLNDSDIFALFSKKFVNSITSSLTLVSWMIRGAVGLIWLLAVFIIALLFSVTVNERKTELGVLRAIGASRGKLLRLVLAEAFLISFYGATTGAALGALIVALVSPAVTAALKLPFLLPSFGSLAVLLLGAVAASVLTGVFGATFSARQAAKTDIYETLRS